MLKARLIEMLSELPGVGVLRDYRERVRFRKSDRQAPVRRNFYARFVKSGDLVFDVGANLGNRSKVFLELGASVVGFEPQPLCADYLANVFRKEPRFQLVRKALGAREGQSEIHISNAHTLSSLSLQWIDATRQSGRFSAYTWDHTERVDITTLDRMIAAYGQPNFIKIDVEGYEYAVLSGLSKICNLLGALRISFQLCLYGSYTESEYKELLSGARFCIWYGCHETQGIGLLETLAAGVPVLVSDDYDNRQDGRMGGLPSPISVRDAEKLA